MTQLTLAEIESAVRANWALDTCDDVVGDEWAATTLCAANAGRRHSCHTTYSEG